MVTYVALRGCNPRRMCERERDARVKFTFGHVQVQQERERRTDLSLLRPSRRATTPTAHLCSHLAAAPSALLLMMLDNEF